MAKLFPKFCEDCRWSVPNPGIILLKCKHPIVCNINSFELGTLGKNYEGVFCSVERGKRWFGQCGRKGKLWEMKENAKAYKAPPKAI